MKVSDANSNVVAETSADGNGQYEFAGLPDGVLRMEAEATGFQTVAVNGITASGGAVLQHDARLQVGNMAQTVEVTASAPSMMTSEMASLFVRQQSINKAVDDALRRILAQKDVVSELDSRKEARDEEMKKIFDDQQRLRENMKALKGSSEEKLVVQRYTQQLNDQETRLEKLGKEMEQIQKEIDAAQGVVDQMIRELAVDTAV